MKNANIDVKTLLKNKDLVISLVVILVGGIVLNQIYSAKKTENNNLKMRIETEVEKNDLYGKIGSLDNKISKYSGYGLKEDKTTLVNNISSIAAKNNLKIENINFEDDDSSGTRRDSKSQNNQEFYSLVPIRVVLFGKFHDFGKFISEVESSEQFLKVAEVKIYKNEKQDGSQFEESLERFNILINAVIIKE